MQGYHKPAHRRVQSADEQQWGHRIHGVRAAEPAAAAATMGCGGLKPTSEHILPTLLFFKKKRRKKLHSKKKVCDEADTLMMWFWVLFQAQKMNSQIFMFTWTA